MRPKILFVDIETSPLLVYTFGVNDQYVSTDQIYQDWNILSYCAKWGHENKVIYRDLSSTRDKTNDKALVKDLWKLLNEADVVIGQNLDRFDKKKINARIIFHGMQPPSFYKTIDTLKINRKNFGFTSNKLAYVTEFLDTKRKKLKHKKFPGLDLWKECLKNNPEAWEEMQEYNINDVLSLEDLYRKVAPWDSSVNFGVYRPGNVTQCDACGSVNIIRKGHYYTSVGKYQKWRCKDCGHETYEGKNLAANGQHKGVKR